MEHKRVNIISWGIIILVIVCLVYGCKTNTVYIPVETVRTEFKEMLFRDSVYLHDSVLVKIKGDTIWLEKYKYLYRDKLVRDSVFVTDSVQVPYPVVEYREVNRLYTWQTILMCLGAVLIGFTGYRLFRFFKK